MSKRLAISVYILSILFFSCFFIWPIWEIIRGGFFDYEQGFTLSYLKTVFQNPVYVEGLFNSFTMGIGSTLLGLVIAVPLAYLFNGYDFWGKRFFFKFGFTANYVAAFCRSKWGLAAFRNLWIVEYFSR